MMINQAGLIKNFFTWIDVDKSSPNNVLISIKSSDLQWMYLSKFFSNLINLPHKFLIFLMLVSRRAKSKLPAN